MCELKRTQDEAGFVRQAIKKYLPHQRSRSVMEITDTQVLQRHTGYIYTCRREVCGWSRRDCRTAIQDVSGNETQLSELLLSLDEFLARVPCLFPTVFKRENTHLCCLPSHLYIALPKKGNTSGCSLSLFSNMNPIINILFH